MCELQQLDARPEKLVELLSQDANLVFKLLRLINSDVFGLTRKIESLREAIIILGAEQLRTFASLIVLSNVQHKPRSLFLTVLHRAKMSELLAKKLQQENSEIYFTAGMFSLIDAMQDSPLPELLEPLSLAPELNNALLWYEGMLGAVVNSVIAYERADWQAVQLPKIVSEDFTQAYLHSILWTEVVAKALWL